MDIIKFLTKQNLALQGYREGNNSEFNIDTEIFLG